MLTGQGFSVVGEAGDGAGPLRRRELRPDLVLLDIQLPDVDGFVVADALAGAADPPDVVLMSSRASADYGSRVSDARSSASSRRRISAAGGAAVAAGPGSAPSRRRRVCLPCWVTGMRSERERTTEQAEMRAVHGAGDRRRRCRVVPGGPCPGADRRRVRCGGEGRRRECPARARVRGPAGRGGRGHPDAADAHAPRVWTRRRRSNRVTRRSGSWCCRRTSRRICSRASRSRHDRCRLPAEGTGDRCRRADRRGAPGRDGWAGAGSVGGRAARRAKAGAQSDWTT